MDIVAFGRWRITVSIDAGTVTFPDSESDADELYEVLVSVVNSPFSFYVQIRDEDRVRQNPNQLTCTECSICCVHFPCPVVASIH